jgi:hypothetical protein
MSELEQLVDALTTQLSALVEAQALELARSTVAAALGGRKPGRPAGLKLAGAGPRRKLPRQLCPVPGCRNTAAPVFGMVCSEHKDLPKAKINKYREARRAAKLGKASKPAALKTRKSRTPVKARQAPEKTKKTKKTATKRAAPKKKAIRRTKAAKRTAPAAEPAKTAPPAAPLSPPATAAA